MLEVEVETVELKIKYLMMDKLEKYIDENRDSFDSASPSSHLWNTINERLDSKKVESKHQPKMMWMITRMAAAFAVVLASGVVIGYYVNSSQSNVASNDPIFQDYIDVEKKYVKDINHKMNALSVHDVDPNVNKDLMQLDEVYEDLKKELYQGHSINNDKIIEALLTNYQEKVEILEKVLSRVQNSNEDIQLNNLRHDSLSI